MVFHSDAWNDMTISCVCVDGMKMWGCEKIEWGCVTQGVGV